MQTISLPDVEGRRFADLWGLRSKIIKHVNETNAEIDTMGREPTADERAYIERAESWLTKVDAKIDEYAREQAEARSGELVRLATGGNMDQRILDAGQAGESVTFGPEQRDGVSAWAKARYPGEFAEQLSLSKYLRGITTGNWRGAEAEHRALSEGSSTAGQTLVPTPLASGIIDKARAQTRVLSAGGRTVPMDAQTLKIARITGDPSPAWRSEAGPIAESNSTFDVVTLTAQSMAFYVKASRELVEDASAGNGVDAILQDQFAAVVALELDRAALIGTGTAPEPRGVVNQTGVTLTDHGTNGTNIGSDPATKLGYDFLSDAAGVIMGNNFIPSGIIYAPRTHVALAKVRETATGGAYLQPPALLAPRYFTKTVPITLTVGSSSDCSYVFSGDWSQLLLGIRTELRIDVLKEALMTAAGQYAYVAWMRADIQLAQPSAFVVDRGVRGFA
jgi:HK97 family phage major capsid protein